VAPGFSGGSSITLAAVFDPTRREDNEKKAIDNSVGAAMSAYDLKLAELEKRLADFKSPLTSESGRIRRDDEKKGAHSDDDWDTPTPPALRELRDRASSPTRRFAYTKEEILALKPKEGNSRPASLKA